MASDKAYQEQFKAEVKYGYKHLDLADAIVLAEAKAARKEVEPMPRSQDPLPSAKELYERSQPAKKRDYSWLWVIALIVGLAILFTVAA